MIADPGLTPVTRPFLSTVTTSTSELLHATSSVISICCLSLYNAVTDRISVVPTSNSNVDGARTSDSRIGSVGGSVTSSVTVTFMTAECPLYVALISARPTDRAVTIPLSSTSATVSSELLQMISSVTSSAVPSLKIALTVN